MIGENIETPYKRWVIDNNNIRNPVRKKQRCSIVFLQKKRRIKKMEEDRSLYTAFLFSSSKVSKLIPTRKQQKHFLKVIIFLF